MKQREASFMNMKRKLLGRCGCPTLVNIRAFILVFICITPLACGSAAELPSSTEAGGDNLELVNHHFVIGTLNDQSQKTMDEFIELASLCTPSQLEIYYAFGDVRLKTSGNKLDCRIVASARGELAHNQKSNRVSCPLSVLTAVSWLYDDKGLRDMPPLKELSQLCKPEGQ